MRFESGRFESGRFKSGRFKSGTAAAIVAVCALLSGCGTSSGTTASSATTIPTAVGSSPTVASAPASSIPSSSVPASSAPAATSSAPASSAATSSAPASSSEPAQSTPADSAPKRIVSLSASATEDLYAIGAGAQVVAVDSNSNYPAGVPTTKLSAYEPNVESIAKYSPDLVVLSDDINNIKAQLTKLKIPVLVEPAATSLDDTYRQIQSLGTATGHTAAAIRTVNDMRAKITALIATVPKRTSPLTYFHELDNTLYTASSKTFVGQLYTLAGLKNIADADNPKATPYPQLSAEYLVKADPDLVFLADTKCCQQSATTFAARPGFSVLSAVGAKQVVSLDDDVASRWGPRVVNLLAAIIKAVKSVRTS
ncbi:iron complex transport system substrate-binding protein [Nakamurella sp. UYEF19]|uniref:ABC transporter substrate-binding protein n=1 Tax=Nakamurella sp. UYEF19 TaxID=1756392 RepID=UPI003397FC30